MAIHNDSHQQTRAEKSKGCNTSLRANNTNTTNKHTGLMIMPVRCNADPIEATYIDEPPSPVQVRLTQRTSKGGVYQMFLTDNPNRPIPNGTEGEMVTRDGRRVRGSIQMSEAHNPYGTGPALFPTMIQSSGKPERISQGCSLHLFPEDSQQGGQRAFLRPSAAAPAYRPPTHHSHPRTPSPHPMGPVEYLLSTGAPVSAGSFCSSRSSHTPPSSTCSRSRSPSTSTSTSTSPSPSPSELETIAPENYPKHNMGPPPPPEWAVDFHRSYIGTVTRRDRAGTGLCEHKQTQRIRFRNSIAAYQCGYCSLRWTVKAHKIKSIDYTRVTSDHAAHFSKVVEARTPHRQPPAIASHSCRCLGANI